MIASIRIIRKYKNRKNVVKRMYEFTKNVVIRRYVVLVMYLST